MIKFTFKTDSDYNAARMSGYIPQYNTARFRVYHPAQVIADTEITDPGFVDFPVHSQEEYDILVQRYTNAGSKFETYSSEHSFDINDYQ